MTNHHAVATAHRNSWRGPGRRTRRGLVATGLALVAAVALACSGSTDSSESSDSGAGGSVEELGSPRVMDAADGDAAGAAAESAGGVTATPELAVSAAGREQVFTAQVQLQVESLDTAVDAAATAVAAVGGFAAAEDVDLSGDSTARIVYRVPAEQFRPALAALSDIGELRSQTLDSTDVSAQYADLESRLVTMRTSIGRLQSFLSETTDVNQIAALEGELTRREAELESIEGQRRALADQVALSTITVSFDATRATPATSSDADRPGFAGGLDAGWDVLVELAAAGAAVAGFLLPFLPLLLVAAAILWWAMRRRTRRVPVDPASAA